MKVPMLEMDKLSYIKKSLQANFQKMCRDQKIHSDIQGVIVCF